MLISDTAVALLDFLKDKDEYSVLHGFDVENVSVWVFVCVRVFVCVCLSARLSLYLVAPCLYLIFLVYPLKNIISWDLWYEFYKLARAGRTNVSPKTSLLFLLPLL